MKRKVYLTDEKIPAVDGTICKGCRETIEISLLVPPKSFGGNRRRFRRYYQCENCTRTFCKYDFVYGLIFLISPRRIVEYLFTSPRTRLRTVELEGQPSKRYRGQFRPVERFSKESVKSVETVDKETSFNDEAELIEPKRERQSRHLV